MKIIKKLLLIPMFAIVCVFARIDLCVAGSCDIDSLDTSIKGKTYGYTCLNGNAGTNESNYGLTTGSGEWAAEFSYGTVWGMANCNNTSGTYTNVGTPTLASSGEYCWCQATGFTASGNAYTSGPQCTTSASSSWVFYNREANDGGAYCASLCANHCAGYVANYVAFRVAVFGSVPKEVELNWYNNGVLMSEGPSFCAVGGTFLPPTPSARTGFVFNGWKETCASKTRNKIRKLDSSINGKGTSYQGYTCLNGNAGSNETNYGLTTGSGEWAVEFSYGTVWGMANCNNTSGTANKVGTPTLASSGSKCWCQANGFVASGNAYTSGPQCTIVASSSWVFSDSSSNYNCALNCAGNCAYRARAVTEFRKALFSVVGQ